MAGSYTLRCPPEAERSGDKPRSVIVTGASGRIGSYFCKTYARFYELTLMVRPGEEVGEELAGCGSVVHADLREPESLKREFDGMDTILHLAANPSPHAKWPELLENNIEGTYNAMEAARLAGCRRLIFASSIHAVSGYPAGFQVHDHDPVNPGDLYGVSKCFGEALGRYMAAQRGLSVIALRIGAFQPRAAAKDPDRVRLMDAFLSRRDLGQLIQRCIDNTTLQFAVFHALSNNRFNRMDISGPCELVGYDPEDDFTEENPALEDLGLRRNVRPNR